MLWRARSYLELEAALGTEFLHPGGAAATDYLLSRVPLSPGDRVLDLGCGTGATARAVAHRGVMAVAVDIMPRMLAEAARRQRVLSHPHPHLVRADVATRLPFRDASFEAVWAESVLAIADSVRSLSEVVRVLRPSGWLALNERIWRPQMTAEEVARINALSRRCFGIPAATEAPLDRNDWISLLQGLGLQLLEVAPIDAVVQAPAGLTVRDVLSRQLRYLGEPWMLVQSIRWRWLARRHRSAWSRLEGWIFLARRAECS